MFTKHQDCDTIDVTSCVHESKSVGHEKIVYVECTEGEVMPKGTFAPDVKLIVRKNVDTGSIFTLRRLTDSPYLKPDYLDPRNFETVSRICHDWEMSVNYRGVEWDSFKIDVPVE